MPRKDTVQVNLAAANPNLSPGRTFWRAAATRASRLRKKASCRLMKKIQRRGARKSTSGGVLRVRCSETIERQRSIWVFFISLLESYRRDER
jgi:hypothetical protein